MGKQPAFQFYPGDWFREPGLRASSIAAKGAWAQILFSMHDAKEKGKLFGDLEYWGNLIGIKSWGEWEQHRSYMCAPWTKDSDSSKDTALSLIRELVEKEVCDIKFNDDLSRQIFYDEFDGADNGVTARSCNVTIINRRMYRKFLEAERKRKNQQNYRYRQKAKKQRKSRDQNVTDKRYRNVITYSSSSTSLNTSLSSDTNVSSDKQPSAAPFKKKSGHFSKKINEDLVIKIDQVCTKIKRNQTLQRKKFNGWKFAQKNCNAHPQAILHVLEQIEKQGDMIKSPWAYANKVLHIESQNYNERETVQAHKIIKDLFAKIFPSDVRGGSP